MFHQSRGSCRRAGAPQRSRTKASEVGTSAVLCPGEQRPRLIHLLGNVFLRSSVGGLKQHKDDE